MPDDEEEDDDDLEACCLLAEETGESHYHCANCGAESGMMGHTDAAGEFTCQPSASWLASAHDDEAAALRVEKWWAEYNATFDGLGLLDT